MLISEMYFDLLKDDCIYIYIYIYRERERGKESEREREIDSIIYRIRDRIRERTC